MHGIVHQSLKHYVVDRANEDDWETVRRRAGIATRLYLPIKQYPADEVVDVLSTVATLTEHPEGTLQRDFGRYFAPRLLATFSAHVDSDWDGLDAIVGLEYFFSQLVDDDDDLREAALTTDRPDPRTVVVTYRSPVGLCPLVEGVVHGVGEHFGTDLAVTAESRVEPHDEECSLTVTRA